MRFFALLLGLAVVPTAHADISDSGNLSIGGNGVIFGSMTVIGPIAASIVTLSSSGAGPYDLTSSTGIHVLSGQIKLEPGAYINWGDGSTSNTASPAGASVLNATQTFSGANTFTSTINVKGIIQSSPGGYVENIWTVSGSTFNVNYSTSITFAITSSTNSYRLHFNITGENSPGEINVIFNGDTSGVYVTQYHGVVENGAAIANGDSIHNYCSMQTLNASLLNHGWAFGFFEFGVLANGGQKGAGGGYQSYSNRANTNRDSVEGGCFYPASAAINRITFRISAGYFVGDVWLEKLNK